MTLWAVGEILTASNMNTYISNILDDLKGTNGPIEYTDAIVVDSLTPTERDALTAVNGMVIYNSTLSVFQRYENGAWVSFTNLATMTIASAAQGDVFFRGATAIQRLAAGTDRQSLRTQGSTNDPIWADLEDLRVAPTTAQGDVFYIGSNGRINRLAPGAIGAFFTSQGANADPVWEALAGATFVRLTTGTSWTVPASANIVWVELVGGGCGGYRGGVPGKPRAGEGGFVGRYTFLASELGTTVTYAIGAGGTGTAYAGSAGGNTVFAGRAIANGGRGGTITTSPPALDFPQATALSGADGGLRSQAGFTGLPTTAGGGAGGVSGNPGANGGAGTVSLNGLGGGGGGGGHGNNDINYTAGGAGGIPGGGGGNGGEGGGLVSTGGTPGNGGAGARGEIRIWYW